MKWCPGWEFCPPPDPWSRARILSEDRWRRYEHQGALPLHREEICNRTI